MTRRRRRIGIALMTLLTAGILTWSFIMRADPRFIGSWQYRIPSKPDLREKRVEFRTDGTAMVTQLSPSGGQGNSLMHWNVSRGNLEIGLILNEGPLVKRWRRIRYWWSGITSIEDWALPIVSVTTNEIKVDNGSEICVYRRITDEQWAEVVRSRMARSVSETSTSP